MERLQIYYKVLSPVVAEVLRVKKWDILRYVSLFGMLVTIPKLLRKAAK